MGYRKANEIAKKLPGKMIVSIADREGDIYDLYHEAQENFEEGSAYCLIRATTDRRLMGKQGHKIKTKNVVIAKEIQAPKGRKPIEWVTHQ